MKKLTILFVCSLLSTQAALALGKARALPDPEVVSEVNLDRYVGKWYEIAHSPNFFQRKCVSSTAEYQILAPGKVSVYNTCYKASGRTSDISGTAVVVNPDESSAKLKVRFSFFQKGDYWVTELDPDYQWAVVSSPGKKFTFILSRVAPMPAEQLNMILSKMKSKGFNTDALVFDRY